MKRKDMKKRQIKKAVQGQCGRFTIKEFCELCHGIVVKQGNQTLTVGKNGFKVIVGAED